MDREESVDYLPLKFISFSQCGQFFTIVSKTGFHVFSVDPLEKKFEVDGTDIISVQMVYTSNFIGYLKRGGVYIFNMAKNSVIHHLPGENVKSFLFTPKYVILVFESMVDVYDRDNLLEKYWFLQKTGKNELGVCCSSANADMFAVPGEKVGEVKICDIRKKLSRNVCVHANPIRSLSMNTDGKILATSSENGRIIKLVDCESAKQIRELRRGTTDQIMFSIALSGDNKSLCCYSSSGTIHQFNIDSNTKNTKSSFSGLGYLGISYYDSEWSSNSISLTKGGYGKVKFPLNVSNKLLCIQETGIFTEIEFSEKEKPIATKTISLLEKMKSRIAKKSQSVNVDHIPLILDLKTGFNIQKLGARKYSILKNTKVNLFLYKIWKRLGLNDGETIKLYVGNETLNFESDTTLGDVHQKYQDKDGYLYLEYSN